MDRYLGNPPNLPLNPSRSGDFNFWGSFQSNKFPKLIPRTLAAFALSRSTPSSITLRISIFCCKITFLKYFFYCVTNESSGGFPHQVPWCIILIRNFLEHLPRPLMLRDQSSNCWWHILACVWGLSFDDMASRSPSSIIGYSRHTWRLSCSFQDLI